MSEILLKQFLKRPSQIASVIPSSKALIQRVLLLHAHAALSSGAHSALITYQVTNELLAQGHCRHFARAETEYCWRNFPPMFVTKFYKSQAVHGTNG